MKSDQKSLFLHQIKTTDSLFNFTPGKLSFPRSLKHSFKEMGLILPILVFHHPDGSFHLVDGFKRVDFALESGWSQIEAMVYSPETPLEMLFTYVAAHRQADICRSAVGKMRFLYALHLLGFSADTLKTRFFAVLDLPDQPHLIHEMFKIMRLPDEVLTFADEKGFSHRQLLGFTRYDVALLKTVFSWKSMIHLTASTAIEILDMLQDILRRYDKPLEVLITEKPMAEVLNSNLPPHQKTQRLRKTLLTLHQPTLTIYAEKMTRIRDELKLPSFVSLDWDSSLEVKALRLHASISSEEDWNTFLTTLRSPHYTGGITTLLDYF